MNFTKFMKSAIAIIAVLLVVTAIIRPASAQSSTNNVVYVVQPGDNLYRIGLKFNTTIAALAQANGIVNPNLIVVGQRLIIPGVQVTAMPGTATEQSETLAPTSMATTPSTPTTPSTYTVQAGDNLYRIALKFNTTIFVLGQLNGLINLNLVYVGQVLRLPVGARVAPTSAATRAATSAATTAATAATAATESATEEVIATEAPTEAATIAATEVAALPTAAATSVTFGTGGAVINAPSSVTNVGFAVGFEVSASQAPADLAKMVSDLGASWVKQTADWKSIEKTQGTRDYAALDAAISAYNAAGLKILVTITNAPDWARTTQNEDGPPNDLNTFSAFVTDIATRYKGKVQAYEIWNEPNLRRNWNGKQLGGSSYIELLRLAYAAIKSIDGSVTIVSAGLSPTGFNDGVNAIDDRVFLRQEYSAGLTAFADAVGAHPSGWANPPDATCCQPSPGVTGWYNSRSFYFRDTLNDYRQIMKTNRDNGKFIWVTAFGWGSAEGVANESSVNESRFGFVKFTSQAKQAQYLTRGFEIGRDLAFVGPMFAYNLNACQSVGDNATGDSFYPCYYSLLDASGKPRPAFDAVKALKK